MEFKIATEWTEREWKLALIQAWFFKQRSEKSWKCLILLVKILSSWKWGCEVKAAEGTCAVPWIRPRFEYRRTISLRVEWDWKTERQVLNLSVLEQEQWGVSECSGSAEDTGSNNGGWFYEAVYAGRHREANGMHKHNEESCVERRKEREVESCLPFQN